MERSRQSFRTFGRNFLALLIAGGSLVVAQLNADPVAAGSEPGAKAVALPPAVPMPELLENTAIETNIAADEAEHSEPAREPQYHAIPHDDPKILRGIWALKMATALLEQGCESFAKIPDYTATMFKQERIGGVLSDAQSIDLKIRHEPFSVYMKWTAGDRGRQVIYVDGQNEGNMLVQPGGLKGRLTGVMSLDPNGSLAMSECRYPITKAGLLELAKTILEFHHADLERGGGFRSEIRDDQMFEDRPCYLYLCEYDSPEVNPVYRKCMVFVDKELSMPICVKNFTWGVDVNPERIDEETLVEFYAYSGLRFEQSLGSNDFDHHNKDYRLRVRR